MQETRKREKIEVQKEKKRKKQIINQNKINNELKKKECLQFNQKYQVYH